MNYRDWARVLSLAVFSWRIGSCDVHDLRERVRVQPHSKAAAETAQRLLESNTGHADVIFEIGKHHISKDPLNLRGTTAVFGHQLRDGGARGGEGEVQLHGSWKAEAGLLEARGRFQNVVLSRQRAKEAPRRPVRVFGIDAGEWDFVECEVTGAGTGVDACGLMDIGGDGYCETSEEDEDEAAPIGVCEHIMDDRERNPVVRIQSCVLQKLPDSELLDPRTPLNYLLFLRNHSVLDIEDSELNGGDTNALFLYDDSLARVRGSLLKGAACSIGIDDAAKIVLEKNKIRENGSVFHVWSHRAALHMRGNDVVGEVFEDMDRFSNHTLLEEDNDFSPPFSMRAPGFFLCNGCGQPQYRTTLDRWQQPR